MRRSVIFVILTVVCFVNWNCAEQQYQPDNSPYCNIYLSRTKGMVNKHFASQITYSSNFVERPEYIINTPLPPGLYLDASNGIIQGTPTQAGFWQVEVRVRDRNKGTHGQPAGENWSYYKRFEIAMYDRYVDENN